MRRDVAIVGCVDWIVALAALILGLAGMPAWAESGATAGTEQPLLKDPAGKLLSERIAARDVAAAFPPLDDPPIRSADAADHLRPDDVVVGLVIEGAARAYPWWVLKNYHTVNDTLNAVEVLIAFCEQCSAATAFHRRLDDRLLSMETEGVCGGSIILRDRQTGTLWAPFDGQGLEGPLASRKLDRLPVFLTTWTDWKTRHPKTDVVYDSSDRRAGHGAREHPGKWGIMGTMGETLLTWDMRLSENDFVFGTRIQSLSRAFPLRAVQQRGGAVNDTLVDEPVAIFTRGAFEMAGYSRKLEDRVLTFEGVDDHFRDRETGSLWNIEGLAVEGKLAGRRLEPLDGYLVEWHVWAEYHPQSEIFGLENYQEPRDFRWPLERLAKLSGETVQEDFLRIEKDVGLIYVWARWCPPCVEKMPAMQSLVSRAESLGFDFLSIVVQLPDLEELSALKTFIYQRKVDWPVYLFADDEYARLDQFYRERGGRGLVIPMAFIVNREGMVLRVLEGPSADQIESALRGVLAVQPQRDAT